MNRNILSIVMAVILASAASAQTSFPMITHAYPVAVQRGTTVTVDVVGRMNFAGAYKALFEGKGVTAEATSPPATGATITSVKMKVAVAKDAPLGVREFRIATSLGLSSVGQLVIVDDPVVLEKPNNNTVPQAQTIKLPCVLAGKLEVVEDVDYFKFDAKAGEVVTFEMYCARIQDKIHDLQKHAKPMLTLLDSEGRELAANDHFFFADPLLSFKIAKAGTYHLQVRESTYDGDPRWVYAIVATNRPYASHVFPMAGNPGATIDVEPIGSARFVRPKVSLKIPETLGVQQVRLDMGGSALTPNPSPKGRGENGANPSPKGRGENGAYPSPKGRGEQTNPATFIVSKLPQYIEQEPNDEPAKANRITLPAGINGRIGKKRDIDHYAFEAKKGRAVRFELKARRFGTLLNSSLHGILEIMNAKGNVIAANDTTHGQEAALVFTPAVDGDYVLRVRDLNSKGSESSVYYVEADWATPDFTIRCDPDKTMIGPGSSTSWYVHVIRQHGFTGAIEVMVKGLPKEITACKLTIPPSMTQGVIVLTAAANAGLTAAPVEVIGTAKVKSADGKEETLVRGVASNQEIYLPGGGRGRFDVNMQTVAVTTPSDILKVDVSTTNITLKPGEEIKIEVTLTRRGDYDKGVFLDVMLRHLGSIIGNPLPPGVTIVAGKSKTLLGNGSKGYITLKADAKAAPIENVPISVIANVSINFVVKVHYSSVPILITIRK
ncbi:MAG: PPC domain-containing protein [Planctomycetes bacterium]|nr:PPC domain-containing protein [Planctomycetota bacterium]